MNSIVLAALLFAAPATAKPCREHPEVNGPCFVVRGRLQFWNGSPSFRITVSSTGRILGVSDQRFRRDGFLNLPADLEARAQKGPFTANFEVCPFTVEKPGVMRLVCVQSARGVEAAPAPVDRRVPAGK